MIKKWMIWTAGAAVAVAVPTIGQARQHYSGVTPLSVMAVKNTSLHTSHFGKASVKTVAHKKAAKPVKKKHHHKTKHTKSKKK